MPQDFSFLIASTLIMHLVSTGLLAGFWWKNRASPGLATITLSPAATGIGLILAFGFGAAQALYHVAAIYVFLIVGHATAWIGLAGFWHQKTKRLTAAVSLLSVMTFGGVLAYQSNGGVPTGRTALVSAFFAVSSFAIAWSIFRAKGFRIDIYENAFRESRVGSNTVVVLFLVHGIFNLYRALSWPDLGTPNLFASADAVWVNQYTIFEALMFTPIFVIGVIMMVAERLQTELRVEQMLEPVTRSLNRRAFITVCKVVLARARRNADAVSILLVEVGNFREIRDAAGRTGCDKIFKQVSTAIVAGRREQDIFGRFSNDEFLLILPGTPEEGAQQVLDRVEAEINRRSFHQKGKDITVRAKLAFFTARGEDLEAEGMIDAVAQKLASR